jgi:3-oxoacyl-[acyl-carrier protein] reductase
MGSERRVAMITGAARGIGYETAKLLAQAGCTVIIADMSPDRLKQAVESMSAEGFPVEPAEIDVSDIPRARKIVADVINRHGRIDILVNNAGICPTTSVDQISEEEWGRVMDVNLKGAFFLCQAVIPVMKEQHYGRIVNISSIAGEMGALVAGCHYSISKAGIIAMTKVLARQLGTWGITVNAVAPGTIDSVMTADWSKEQRDMLTARIPVGRLGDPRDIAHAVAFLTSEGSSFITGATIDVNGGALMR